MKKVWAAITLPILAVLLYVGFLSVPHHSPPSVIATPNITTPKPAPPKPLEVSDIDIADIYARVNALRSADGLQPTVPYQPLETAALAKCNDMVTENYWSHVSPLGVQPWSFIQAQGVTYLKAGENLAEGINNSSSVVNAWVMSPEHKANLLNPYYDHEGIAVCKSNSYVERNRLPSLIVVQEFIQS